MFSSHQLELVERLSDRVGIIRDGSMVAVGDIEALRETDVRRWVVDGPPAERWLAAVPGARTVEADGGRTVVEVPGDHDDDGQALRRRRWGQVRSTSSRVSVPRSLTSTATSSAATPARRKRHDHRPGRHPGSSTASRHPTPGARREVRTRMATKGYRLTTLFFVLAVVAGGVILHAVNASQSTKHVGVTSAAAPHRPHRSRRPAAAAGVKVQIETVTDQAAAEDQVRPATSMPS